MPDMDQIQMVFDDMRLGTDAEREQFTFSASRLATADSVTEQRVFVLCTSETEGEESEDAELATDLG